ncbi:MAG: hypothetical protein R3208_16480 [Ketobacteraceae bacterium]|nr:hypothetical protein [Ketobacteraceae bacterium]
MVEPVTDKQVLLGFSIPAEDAGYILELLRQMRLTPNKPGLSAEAAGVVARLLDLGIHALYFDVMDKVRAHPKVKKSADTGIHTVSRGGKLVIKKMVNSLEPHELPVFAEYMSSLLVQHDAEWHLAFPLSPELANDLGETMKRIHSDSNTSAYNDFIATTLCAICDQAIVYFYHKPTKLFKIRPFVKRSADLGVRTIQKGLHFVIRQLFKKTHQRELIKFSQLLENQLVYD